MNQDIDLLAAVSAERQHFPSAIHAAITIAAAIAVAILSASWLSDRAVSQDKEMISINDSIDDLVFNLEERSRFLVDRNADPLLLEQIAERERELADKTRVLDLLSGETLGNTKGFAAQLAALGRRHPDGLWLQRVTLDDGGRRLELRGRALDANLVPDFLDLLESEAAFSGVTFGRVDVATREDDLGVDFVLASGCEAGEGEPSDAVCVPEDSVSLNGSLEPEGAG